MWEFLCLLLFPLFFPLFLFAICLFFFLIIIPNTLTCFTYSISSLLLKLWLNSPCSLLRHSSLLWVHFVFTTVEHLYLDISINLFSSSVFLFVICVLRFILICHSVLVDCMCTGLNPFLQGYSIFLHTIIHIKVSYNLFSCVISYNISYLISHFIYLGHLSLCKSI